ncbi:MAG: FHA domain-containing protein, partial [Leptolyngbyaceae cyanobacterium SM1_4_3]|nr:FHA domain-containing protein [Leptolyngbyaceae cyanobacterium SM1_4_3]
MIKIRAIYYQTGESQEKILTPEALTQGGGLIGRNPNCDLVLNSPEVSRVHGRILYQAGQYYYTDLGSTDGSQVNDQTVQTNQNFLLQPDDLIRIGGFILLIKELDLQAAALNISNATLIDGSSKAAASNAALSGNLGRADSAQTGLDGGSLQNGSLNSLSYTFQANASAGASAGSEAPVVQRLMFKAEELKEKGILSQGLTECTFQGKVLVEGISFAKRLRENAVDLWQAELDSGKLCLLVEYPEHFTLWYEKEGWREKEGWGMGDEGWG